MRLADPPREHNGIVRKLLRTLVVYDYHSGKKTTRKAKTKQKKTYAHIEIVVTFLVVKIFGFLVITRSPLQWNLVKIGGNESYRPPGAFYTKIFEIKTEENQNLRVQIFE